MANRNHSFAVSEHYHCYNRGTEKRNIFLDQQDFIYFTKSLKAYNSTEVLGKLRLHDKRRQVKPPVTVLSYCLLPNHFHLVLRNNYENGISKFIQRVSGGYTMYFNQKYERSGSLFQGTFKSKYIETDQNLRQILAYTRYNYLVHSINNKDLYRSSLNCEDDLVRGLTSNFKDENQKEVVEIIKQLREDQKNEFL